MASSTIQPAPIPPTIPGPKNDDPAPRPHEAPVPEPSPDPSPESGELEPQP